MSAKRRINKAAHISGALLIVAAALTLFARPPKVATVAVRLSATSPDTCLVRIESGAPEQVEWRTIDVHFRERGVLKGTAVSLSAEKAVPYHPVGQVILILQDAGYLVGFSPEDIG